MSEWYERAYPGGQMVGPPFTRPLYPPDAKSRGKTPSTDGGDVLAVKRACWRGGHWPGPASNFDDAFSNAFSHGKSGNVSENGLAGVQRQNGIEASGWMGEQTYNLLRSARIPVPLPNAGQPLFDQTAIDLLTKFRASYLGKTVRAAALSMAQTFLGYKESPPGTNGNMFGEWYGMNFEPWCAMFVSYCYEKGGGGGSPSFRAGSAYSYVPYIVSDARAKRNGLQTTSDPMAGDLVCYDWQGDGTYDHIGLFEGWTGGRTLSAIEGNTSTSNDSNGGQVMRRQRDAASTAIVFVRVAEP